MKSRKTTIWESQGIQSIVAFFSDEKRFLITLAFLALAIRTGFVLLAEGIGDPNAMDAQNYLRIAKNLVEGNGFVVWSKPSIFVAPFYPFFLAALRLIGIESIVGIKIVQAIISSGTVLLFYFLVKNISTKQIASIAAVGFCFHPELIGLTAFIYTETLFIFLVVLFLFLLVKAIKSGKMGFFIYAGFVLGITNLCRGTMLYLPVFLLLTSLLFREGRTLKYLRNIVLMTVVTIIVLIPWTIRNYNQFNAFVPIASGLGAVLWTGTYLPLDGEFSYKETQKHLQAITKGKSVLEADRALKAAAIQNVISDPVESAFLFVRKIGRYWGRVYEDVPSGEKRSTNMTVYAILVFTHLLTVVFAVFGVYYRKIEPKVMLVFATLVVYYTLIHAVTLPVARYRQPLLPILICLAAVGFVGLLEQFKSRNT
ncbi:MAG: glycosyltransferase family 39 protein [Deferribacteres bacterium]|nr:glycosyltransferase family 39 protein [candidate division KSB1 bacterium]MCB9503371.1 glycosyltransferase family 39 protein [Deferribacteres bacterium]